MDMQQFDEIFALLPGMRKVLISQLKAIILHNVNIWLRACRMALLHTQVVLFTGLCCVGHNAWAAVL